MDRSGAVVVVVSVVVLGGLVEDAEVLVGALACAGLPVGRSVAVDFDQAREAVGSLGLPATPAGASDRRRIPISRASRQAMEQSLREARRLRHLHLGVEHLLLALLRDEENGAVRALGAIEVSPDDLERCLGKMLKSAPFASR